MNFVRLLAISSLGACCCGLGSGCSSCEAPYDYSGPTLDAKGKPVGGFGTRVGSVWAGITPGAPPPKTPTTAKTPPAPESEIPATGTPSEGSPSGIGPEGAPPEGAPPIDAPNPLPGEQPSQPPSEPMADESPASGGEPAVYLGEESAPPQSAR